MTKTVSFYPKAGMKIVARHNEPMDLWYTKDDYTAMKVQNVHMAAEEVYKAYIKFSSNPSNVDDDEASEACCMIVGIENALSRDIKVKRNKQRHQLVDAVLKEQDRQDRTGKYDENKLACISQRCSEWARERARRIGIDQSQ